jgi:hypothetical protein
MLHVTSASAAANEVTGRHVTQVTVRLANAIPAITLRMISFSAAIELDPWWTVEV